MNTFTLPQHKLEFRKDHLYSLRFKDVFNSSAGALEQAQHVFVNGNSLGKRLKEEGICIAELGFGSGVNFLATYLEWKKSHSEYPLLYTSIEGFPIAKEELGEHLLSICHSYKGFNEEERKESISFVNELQRNYPTLLRGFHNIKLDKSQVTLNLIFHPAEFALKNISQKFDIWFLDGFSPKVNEDMWSKETLAYVFKLTKLNGTFSTYSTASTTRENANESGFIIRKSLGFSNKREMLCGTKEVSKIKIESEPNEPKPTNPTTKNPINRNPINKNIAVIGGGLAGASLAYSLSKRGSKVTLFEKNNVLFSGASGNERGVLMPQLSSKPDAQCRFFLSGFLHSVRLIKTLNTNKSFTSLNQDGVLRYCNVPKWKSVYNKLEELGFNLLANKITQEDSEALFFHEGLTISPKELGESLIANSKNIDVRLNSPATSFSYEENRVLLRTKDNEFKFDYLIFACAYGSAFIDDLSWIPIEKIKGELGVIETPKNLNPQSMCYDGYVIPLADNKTLIGATYEHNSHDETPSFSTTKDLYKRLQQYQTLEDLKEENYHGGRVCFRTTSPDRLPVIGSLDSESKVYVSIGHGSRGLVSTPLSAELISQMIFKEPLSIESDLLREIEPTRFLNRAKRREKSLKDIYPASFLWR